MTNKNLNVWDINLQDILEIYGFDLTSKNLIYGKSVGAWSWGATLIIWQDGKELYCVDDPDNWNPQKITEDEALQIISDFEE